MWELTAREISPGLHQHAITSQSRTLMFDEVLQLWESSAAFRAFWIEALAGSPLKAFRWETPAISATTRTLPFEFVLHDAPGLPRVGDPASFTGHFRTMEKGTGVVAFRSLGGDATLIVPAPQGQHEYYGHLAAFFRHALDPQKHELLVLMARVFRGLIGPRPIWLSTAGMGVPWLHVRIDTRPKYYGYEPYTRAK